MLKRFLTSLVIIVISHFRVTRSSPKTRFDHERRYRARALSNINSKKFNLLFLWIGFVLVWISRNFKTFILKPKWSFLRENHKNDNLGGFPDFYEFTLYMTFKNFHENSHYWNGHFQKNHENHIKGEFLNAPESTLVIIFMILSKMTI